jgi:hypothetical protein
MRAIKNFEEFVKERVVKKQKPDLSRAEYLFNEVEKAYALLFVKIEKLGVNKDTSNDIIKTCYDIIMELIRAKMLLAGFNASGFGAHEAEVAYTRLLGFKEKEVQLLDQLRYFRNGILYYGKRFDEEYAEKIITLTKKVYQKLTHDE